MRLGLLFCLILVEASAVAFVVRGIVYHCVANNIVDSRAVDVAECCVLWWLHYVVLHIETKYHQ